MDRRLNTGSMVRSVSDRHLANNSPIPDRSLDRASPLLMRSISQSSRLSSRDKRADFEPQLDQLSTTGWSEANSESQVKNKIFRKFLKNSKIFVFKIFY